jgi:hypothetical protein
MLVKKVIPLPRKTITLNFNYVLHKAAVLRTYWIKDLYVFIDSAY